MARVKKELFKIKVLNWEKHNPNRRKSYKYTMIANNFFSDAKISMLTTNQKLLFLGILLACGDHSQDVITMSASQLLDLTRGGTLDSLNRPIAVPSVYHSLGRLQSLQLLTYEKIALIEEKIIEEKEINILPDGQKLQTTLAGQKTVRHTFDFDLAYSNYPRKEGKKRGHERLKAKIKTKEQFDNLVISVNNYSRYCETHTKEIQFIKQWSTFCGEWEDWVEPDSGLFVTEIDSVRLHNDRMLKEYLEEKNGPRNHDGISDNMRILRSEINPDTERHNAPGFKQIQSRGDNGMLEEIPES